MGKSNSKKLISNIGIFTLSMLLPKILSFFLLPLYTSCLSTEDYGVSDLILNTNAILLPIFSICINNAVMLFTIENKSDLRPFRIGWHHFKHSTVVLVIILVVVRMLTDIRGEYLLFIGLIYASNAFSDILMAYLRAQEKMRFIGFCSVSSSVLAIVCNVITIAILHWGAYGFLASTIVGYLVNGIVILFYYRKEGLFEHDLVKESCELRNQMYQYSCPLVFSGLTWWLYSASDRYFVTGMISVVENGVYSVAYKIPNLLQMVQNVFSHAWGFSVIDLYNSEEGRRYAEKVYDLYHIILTLGCSVIIAGDIILAKILYAKDFFVAWRFVPPLVISIVFTALSTFLGSFCIVHKRSDISAKISISTAVLNILFNYGLIKIFNGAMGAAIATAATAGIGWVIRVVVCSKMWDIHIPYVRHTITFMILIIQSVILLATQNYLMEIPFIFLVLTINYKSLGIVYEKCRERVLLQERNGRS